MLVMHRGVEVSTASSNVINFVYNLDVLDYLDPLTGNPNVFDVYLQKYQVIVDYGALFGSSPKVIEFVVVNKIVKNSFDSLQNTGAYLTYKLYSDSLKIYVKYVSFTDVLGIFGSFYSIFSLFAGILSSLYNEIFLDKKLIDSVFKFIKNTPDNKDLESFIFSNKNSFINNYAKNHNLVKSKNPNENKEIELLNLKDNNNIDLKNKGIINFFI